MSKVIYVSYANDKFRYAQKLATKKAKKRKCFDRIIEYNYFDIDKVFYKKNIDILNCKRGNGYWLWKPYFVNKTLKYLDYDDYLLYVDSGAYMLNNVDYLINSMEKSKQDLMCFQLPYFEYQYSKRDAFVLMNCDSKKFSNTKQNMATVFLIKKTKRTLDFVNEWLIFSQDSRIITDSDNTCGKNNYDGFIDNRHDQTVFSLLTKKYNYKPFRDPSQYGNLYRKDYNNSNYPQLFFFHRCSRFKTTLFISLYRFIVDIINSIRE